MWLGKEESLSRARGTSAPKGAQTQGDTGNFLLAPGCRRSASYIQETARWWSRAKEDRLVQLRADFKTPEVGSCLGTPLPGMTFEPLLCGRYGVYARVPGDRRA